jgi:hypothetical protein
VLDLVSYHFLELKKQMAGVSWSMLWMMARRKAKFVFIRHEVYQKKKKNSGKEKKILSLCGTG